MHNGFRMIGDFVVRPAVKNDFTALGDNLIQTGVGDVKRYADSPLALVDSYCFLVNQEVMGIGGYVTFYEGVAEVWSVWRREAKDRHTKSMLMVAKILNNEFVDQRKIWRLQASRPSGISDTWFEHTGFVKECTMANFGLNGEDTDMYCMIINRHLPSKG